jgi:hypothetical protein
MTLFEGNKFTSLNRDFMKQCDCRGTSTTDRFLLKEKVIYDKNKDAGSRFHLIVDFSYNPGPVCDVCDVPWKEN